MKKKIIIEETIAKQIEIELPDNLEDAQEYIEFITDKYKSGEIIIEDGEIHDIKVQFDGCTDFFTLQI